jgi:FKBP-type peptidyl-prolyl cis-trans isomerase FklB
MRFLAAVLGFVLLAAPAGAAEEPVLKTKKDKVSYAMAVGMARTAQRQGVQIDVAVFARGMYDALEGGKLLMTQEEMKQVLRAVGAEVKAKRERAGAGKKAGSPKKAENPTSPHGQ